MSSMASYGQHVSTDIARFGSRKSINSDEKAATDALLPKVRLAPRRAEFKQKIIINPSFSAFRFLSHSLLPLLPCSTPPLTARSSLKCPR